MPQGWKPMPYKSPYRVLVLGCGTAAWAEATDAERTEVFLPRFKQMLAEWEELGARPLCTFVDDVFKVGKTPDPFWSWYLIFELDDIRNGVPPDAGGSTARETAYGWIDGSVWSCASAARSSHVKSASRTMSSTRFRARIAHRRRPNVDRGTRNEGSGQ